MVSIEVDLAVFNFVTERPIRIKLISFADLLRARPKGEATKNLKRLGLNAQLKHTKFKQDYSESKTKQHIDSEIRATTKTPYGKTRATMWVV